MTSEQWLPSKGTLVHTSSARFEQQDVKRIDIVQLQPTDRPIEDRFSLSDTENGLVCGVYDGHGGSETADYISKELPNRIAAALKKADKQDRSQRVIDACLQLDREIHESFTSTFSFLRSLPFQDHILSSLLNRDHICIKAQRAKAGSTALVACISSGHVELVNVGDCRAIMTIRDAISNQDITNEQLTNDQNPHNSEEVRRLRAEHPDEEETVIMQNRVLGRVGTTRSFGDIYYKEKDKWFALNVMAHSKLTPKHGLSWKHQADVLFGYYKSPPYLTAKPEVTESSLIPGAIFVLATDGLWSRVENEWVAENVWKGLDAREENLALYLIKRMQEEDRNPGDDTTILVVHLRD
ncbi:hypothetical protein V5O48_003501 [Marasmius crinis-equi]|uniref:PPM-type phosphatase domain-containing protein n=1 Tax=Marasmius crinis-equi TaxID=585013 RepID=A0ABR3FSR5_9AGAR